MQGGRIESVACGNGGEIYKIMPSNRMDFVQYRFDGRPVCRSGADMMQGNDPVRIDQDIPTPLVDVPFRLSQPISLYYPLQVSPPCFRPPNVPEGSGEHPVLPVRFAGVIDQKRPGERSFSHVTAGEKVVLERDHRDFHVSPGEFLFPITQLRDVRPAGKSAEVAVKHQQQPVPAVVREKMSSPVTVPKFERWGGFSGQVGHDKLLEVRDASRSSRSVVSRSHFSEQEEPLLHFTRLRLSPPASKRGAALSRRERRWKRGKMDKRGAQSR